MQPRGILHHFATLHHEHRMFQHAHVGQRIALDRDQIAITPRGNRADIGGAVKVFCCGCGGRGNRLDRGHAPFDHFGELPGVVAVGIDPGIGAEQQRYACGMRGAECFALFAADHAFLVETFGKHAVAGAFGQDIVVVVDIHVERGALFARQAKAGVVGQACVFDRVDTGAQRAVDAFGAVRMRRNAQPQHMRLVRHRLHFIERHLLRADGIALGQDAAGGADLDHLRAVLVHLAHQRAEFLGRIGNVGPLPVERRRQFGGVAMPPGGAQRIGRGHNTRAGDFTLFDGLTQRDIGKSVGPDIAHRGEPRVERATRIGNAHHGAELVGELQAGIAAEPGIAGQMDMHVDQAGQQRARPQIDDSGACRNRIALVPDSADPPIDDHHLRIIDAFLPDDVDHVSGTHHHGFGKCGGRNRDQGGGGKNGNRAAQWHRVPHQIGCIIACTACVQHIKRRFGSMPAGQRFDHIVQPRRIAQRQHMAA